MRVVSRSLFKMGILWYPRWMSCSNLKTPSILVRITCKVLPSPSDHLVGSSEPQKPHDFVSVFTPGLSAHRLVEMCMIGRFPNLGLAG